VIVGYLQNGLTFHRHVLYTIPTPTPLYTDRGLGRLEYATISLILLYFSSGHPRTDQTMLTFNDSTNNVTAPNMHWWSVASSPLTESCESCVPSSHIWCSSTVNISPNVNIGFPSMCPVKVQAVIPHPIKAVTCTLRVPDRPTR